MGYTVSIVRDSVSMNEARLTTFEISFPRTLLAEFNTHRDFSRNSASSRAIPVEKMLRKAVDDCYIPVFTSAQAGMQGGESRGSDWQSRQSERVLRLRDASLAIVQEMIDDGVHKQDANRYLEPFLFHTVIVSATRFSNFFAQRCHEAAYPPFRRIAEMMHEAYAKSVPIRLKNSEYHLPYVSCDEVLEIGGAKMRKVSVARCARVSYLQHDGTRSIDKDLELYKKLTEGGHWSPFEHIAKPAPHKYEQSGNFTGWIQFRKEFEGECK